MKLTIKGYFSDKQFFRILLRLSVPIVIQKLLVSSLNMVDTLMVGRLGDVEVAAVGAANQLYFIFMLFMEGIAASCSIFAAQYWGAQDKKRILHVVGLGALVTAVIGGAITALAMAFPIHFLRLFSRDAAVLQQGLDYLSIVSTSYVLAGFTLMLSSVLRAIGNTRLPMLISALSILTNVLFNSLLIFGLAGFPRMGVKGAALATVIARLLELVLLLLFTFRRNSPLRGRLRDYFSFHFGFVRYLIATTLPVFLNDTLWGIGFTMYTVAYGLLGTAALAASQIANTVHSLFMVFSFSVATTSLVMIGNLVGAGELERARDYSKKVLVTSALAGVVAGAVMALLSTQILTLYDVSDAVRGSAINLLRIYGATMPFSVTSGALIIGVFRGGGDPSFAMKSELFALWCIGLPLAFGLVFFYPGATVELLVLCLLLEDLIKVSMGLRHFHKGKWLKPLVEAPQKQ